MAKIKYEIPVKIGDRLELTVESQASSGDGVTHHGGYTLFVPSGLAGDVVVGEVTRVTPRFGVVRVVEPLRLSPDRAAAPCPVFPDCGGCKFQNLLYEKQMEFKVRVVRDSLRHIGKIDPPENMKSVPAENPYGYRNKGSFAVGGGTGNPTLGFFRQGTHEVVDSRTCGILLDPINEVKEEVRRLLVKHRVSIYDETQHKGFFRGLVVRHSESMGETLIGLVTTRGPFPTRFLEEIRDPEFHERFHVTGIVQNLNLQDTNIILGEKNRVLWGENRLIEKIGGLRFQLSLGSFFQVNSRQALVLYRIIQGWAGKGRGIILDAYSGSGGIALWLAKAGWRVLGIEEFSPAVRDARESARLNGIESCEFFEGTVEQHLPQLAGTGEIAAMVLDPPRKGCSEKVLGSVLEIAPGKIIYVSCNPATLARDLGRLHPYWIEDLHVIDMFPQTQHVETAVLLSRE